MKKMRLFLMCALAILFVGKAFAIDAATLAFDEGQQKMHLVFSDDTPFNAIVTGFSHLPAACGEPQRYNEETGQYESGIFAEGVTMHWCELDMFVGGLPEFTPVGITAGIEIYNTNWELLETIDVPDWNELQTPDGASLEYLNDDCTPVLPQTIAIGEAFCATICHGTFTIPVETLPIECEAGGWTPEFAGLNLSVTNRCHPDETECDDPTCVGVDWDLFNWSIRVFPEPFCLVYLTMSYCGVDPGCVCIWRSDEILPVEISSFSAVAGDHEVRLDWSTASESDLKEYRITRSTDRDAAVYPEIYRTTANNSATGANYSFTDRQVENGVTYYYKLHVEDIDGNLSVYNIDGSSVVAEATPQAGSSVVTEYALAQNYPNPFNSNTNFNFTLPIGSDVTLTVFDMLGRQVATVVKGEMAAGSHTVNWSAEGLATGVYMYTLRAGEFSQSKKLVYLK